MRERNNHITKMEDQQNEFKGTREKNTVNNK